MERITLVGYLGQNASIVTINGEEKFIETSLAPANNRKGEGTKSLLWYRLNFPLGLKKMMPHLTKGRLLAVTGNISITAYSDKNGNPIPSCVVYVSHFDLLGKRDDSGSTVEEGTGTLTYSSSVKEELPY